MAIGADSAIEFYGTQDTLGNTTSAVTDASFSDGTNDLNAWTNDDDAPLAAFVLEFTTATTGTANTTVDLYARLLNIDDGTGDAEVPDANFGHIYLGSFPHNNPSTSLQIASFKTGLPNTKTSQTYNFYIQNNTAQTISAGWELHVTPITYGPHA